MTKPRGSWDLYRTFLEVVKDGSLSGAARRLRLTQPTVGRHIDALEELLGIQLFTRSLRGLLPTPVALELLPHAEAMAASEHAFRRAASGSLDELKGVIHITASEIMGCEVLPPMLSAFCAKYSAIDIELHVSNRVQDLLHREADIAIRTMDTQQEAIITESLGIIKIGLYAHKDYIALRGRPESIDDLVNHRLIGFDTDETSFRSINVPDAGLGRKTYSFFSDSDLAQLAALRAGVGIGGCHKVIAARDKSLEPVLPDAVCLEHEAWIAMHRDMRGTRRVVLAFEYLSDALKRYTEVK
jgi:DNA-binding transcriptional LysR family regulator